MAGYGAAAPPGGHNSAQVSCIDRLTSTFDCQAYPGDERSGEALLGLTSGAYAAGIRSDGPTAPYAKAKVAWPSLGSRPISLDHLLGEADSSRYYGFTSQMLRPVPEAKLLMDESKITPHMDAVLTQQAGLR